MITLYDYLDANSEKFVTFKRATPSQRVKLIDETHQIAFRNKIYHKYLFQCICLVVCLYDFGLASNPHYAGRDIKDILPNLAILNTQKVIELLNIPEGFENEYYFEIFLNELGFSVSNKMLEKFIDVIGIAKNLNEHDIHFLHQEEITSKLSDIGTQLELKENPKLLDKWLSLYNPMLPEHRKKGRYLALESAIKSANFNLVKKIYDRLIEIDRDTTWYEMKNSINMQVDNRPIYWLAAVCDSELDRHYTNEVELKIGRVPSPKKSPESYIAIVEFLEDKLEIKSDHKLVVKEPDGTVMKISKERYIDQFSRDKNKKTVIEEYYHFNFSNSESVKRRSQFRENNYNFFKNLKEKVQNLGYFEENGIEVDIFGLNS